LEDARSRLESFEQLQRRRYQEMDETYRENFNAVGLVESRLDEIAAELDMRRRRQVWHRLSWLLVDGLAWLAWLIIWICTFVHDLLKRCRRSLFVTASNWRRRRLPDSPKERSQSAVFLRTSPPMHGERHQKPSAVATRYLIRIGHAFGFSTPTSLAPSAAEQFVQVRENVPSSSDPDAGRQRVD
jgi:hypothetical protein